MYEFNARVRYSETDVNGYLKWSSLVNLLQDCSTFQSEDLGIGVEHLHKIHQAWVLNYWQIDLIRLPKLCDEVIVGTLPYEIKGFMGLRNFYIKDALTGEFLVKANSVWTLLDLEKLRPVKASDEMKEKYVTSEKIDMEYMDRKIILNGTGTALEKIHINTLMLDSNQHVNNEKYIELALMMLPKDFKVKRLRTEYKKQAFLDEVLIPVRYETGSEISIVFYKEGDEEPCVKCQFFP